MNDGTSPKIHKWPFLAGDVLLLAAAAFTVLQGPGPFMPWEKGLCVLAVAVGALLGVAPFVLEYRAVVKLAEADILATTIGQLQRLESIANNVAAATAQWTGVQDQAAQTQRAAKEVADRMTAEAKEFAEFMKKANDAEKATLRLEVDKLRRAEGDWLQVVVGVLDHVFALHLAAGRSGKPELIGQLGAFQHACRDIARRVGVTPFEAEAGETFDAQRHRLPDEAQAVPTGARIHETLAPGISFQGQLLRPVLVALEVAPAESPPQESGAAAATPESVPDQPERPLL